MRMWSGPFDTYCTRWRSERVNCISTTEGMVPCAPSSRTIGTVRPAPLNVSYRAEGAMVAGRAPHHLVAQIVPDDGQRVVVEIGQHHPTGLPGPTARCPESRISTMFRSSRRVSSTSPGSLIPMYTDSDAM